MAASDAIWYGGKTENRIICGQEPCFPGFTGVINGMKLQGGEMLRKRFIRRSVVIAICWAFVQLFALSLVQEADSAPSVFPTGLTVCKPDKVQPGYTIYCVKGYDKAIMLDIEGKEVHTWTIPRMSANIKPLPEGRILAFTSSEDKGKAFDSDALKEFDWDGILCWEFLLPEGFMSFHHDFQRLPNGNSLIMTAKLRTVPQIPHEVRDNIIIEVNKDKDIVWQWSTLDHYDQLGLSDEAKDMIAGKAGLSDVFHSNSIQALPPNQYEADDSRFKSGNILVSQRHTNLVFIIDKETGDIVWRTQQPTVGQHHASMIPSHLQGSGNIILFDNGGYGGYPSVWRLFSRITEFNPLLDKGTWSYSANKTDHRPVMSFFSIFRGGVQRLENGNTLITESDWGRIFEVTRTGEIVWEYVVPYFREMFGTLVNGNTNLIYRAYRVDPSFQTGVCGTEYW